MIRRQRARGKHRLAPARRGWAQSGEARGGADVERSARIGTVAARRPRRHRFRPDLSGALCDAAAGQGRGRRDQDRAAARRAAAPPRGSGQERHPAVRDAQPEQARGDPQPEAPARPRTAVRDGQARRCAARKFLARHDGRSRGRLERLARDQPAPHLRDRHRVWHQRARSRQSGDGSDDPGRLGDHERDRRARRAADEGRADPGRFHGRHPPLCRGADRALRARPQRRGQRRRTPRRGGDAGDGLFEPRGEL